MVGAIVLCIAIALTLPSPNTRSDLQQAERAAMALDAKFIMVNHGEIERLTGYTDFLSPAIAQTPEWISGLYRQQLREQMDYLFTFQQSKQLSLALSGKFDSQAIMRSLLIDFNVIEITPSTFQLQQVPIFGSLFIQVTDNWILLGDNEASVLDLQQALQAESLAIVPTQWQNFRQGKLVAGFAIQDNYLDMLSVDLLLASQQLELDFRSNHADNLWFDQLPEEIAKAFSLSKTDFNATTALDAQTLIEAITGLVEESVSQPSKR